MDLILFSTILTVGVLGMGGVLLLSLVGYFFVPRVRSCIAGQSSHFYLMLSGLIAAIATIMTLVYQFIYHLDVCVLCWWQRIFMYPIEVIVFVALWYQQKHVHVTVAILAFVGSLFAAHHYWNHFQNLVLGKEVVLPCGEIGLVPSCSEFSFTIFGFMTIPGMALLAFISIMILCFFAQQRQSAEMTTTE